MNDFFFGFEHSLLLWCALPVFVVLLLLYLLHRRRHINMRIPRGTQQQPRGIIVLVISYEINKLLGHAAL